MSVDASNPACASAADEARGPTVTPASVTVNVGDTVHFAAAMSPPCGSGIDTVHFRWTSGNASRMTVDSLSGVGVARDSGTVVIVATATYDTTVSGASTVIIRQ